MLSFSVHIGSTVLVPAYSCTKIWRKLISSSMNFTFIVFLSVVLGKVSIFDCYPTIKGEIFICNKLPCSPWNCWENYGFSKKYAKIIYLKMCNELPQYGMGMPITCYKTLLEKSVEAEYNSISLNRIFSFRLGAFYRTSITTNCPLAPQFKPKLNNISQCDMYLFISNLQDKYVKISQKI